MEFYLHNINPHASSEFAEEFFDGRKWGLTLSKNYPYSLVEFKLYFNSKKDADYIVKHNPNVTDMREKFPPSYETVLKLLS